LDRYAGRRVRLKFVADCGPRDHAVTDHGFWGDVRIAPIGHEDAADTPPQTRMTWVNDRPFESVFYFRGIRSRTIRIAVRVEGPEPIAIERCEVYAHPDAIVRVFERGLVLANPSLAPYTFDLAALSPGRQYRRLQATDRQDTTVNDGAPVSGAVQLGERDALFLLQVEAKP
jgi:hypothetical protein